MNRLIIIGNGFDLAHGLPTGYRDFILDYLISSLEQAHNNDNYEDGAMLITKPTGHWEDELFKKLIELLKEQQSNLLLFLNNIDHIPINRFQSLPNPFKIEINNSFIKALLLSCCERWVDIEEFYYKSLLKLVQDNQINEKIEDLNNGFQFLIEKLEKYLSKKKESLIINREFIELWTQEEFFGGKLRRPQQASTINSIDKIVFLDFNYTSTLSYYIDELIHSYSDIEFEIIHIHGNVNSPDNSIIFGFGDEMDDNYKILEKANDNRLLDYIKSFGYFENYNYRNLVEFIDTNPFQVQIMGHSCGLSDRIMLNMIFEHQKCESINIFYHKKGKELDDYKALTQNISRHFNDKAMMRKRVVTKDNSKEIPQLKN